MATRAMLIRDAFMLPMEPLTARPYMEQGKEDSSHHHSKCYACWSVAYQCVPFVFIHERPNSVKSMKMSDTPPHDHDIDPTSSTTTQCKLHACRLSLTSHILAHGIAVTDRPSGGATNIVVGKAWVNECN